MGRAADGDEGVAGQGPAEKAPIPWWGWVFAAGCGVIPVLTMGGLIPGAVGFGGAGGCIAVSRSARMGVGVRVGVCAGIVVACWVVTFALLVGLAMVMGAAGSD